MQHCYLYFSPPLFRDDYSHQDDTCGNGVTVWWVICSSCTGQRDGPCPRHNGFHLQVIFRAEMQYVLRSCLKPSGSSCVLSWYYSNELFSLSSCVSAKKKRHGELLTGLGVFANSTFAPWKSRKLEAYDSWMWPNKPTHSYVTFSSRHWGGQDKRSFRPLKGNHAVTTRRLLAARPTRRRVWD